MEQLHKRLNRHDDRLRSVEVGLSSLEKLPDAIDKLTEKLDDISGVSHEVKAVRDNQIEDRKRIAKIEENQDGILAQINEWKTPMKWVIGLITAASLGALSLQGYDQLSDTKSSETKQERYYEDK